MISKRKWDTDFELGEALVNLLWSCRSYSEGPFSWGLAFKTHTQVVRGLPDWMTEAQLKADFATCGQLKRVSLLDICIV